MQLFRAMKARKQAQAPVQTQAVAAPAVTSSRTKDKIVRALRKKK